MKKFLGCLIIIQVLFIFPPGIYAEQISVTSTKQLGSFPLVDSGNTSSLIVDTLDAEVVTIAATALSSDIKLITDVEPVIAHTIANNYPVIIGTLGSSAFVDSLVKTGKISTSNIVGQWETFAITVVDNPFDNIDQALVIYGSDPRGTAFGVFEFAKLMGVSPWVWWADVNPEKRAELYVTKGESIFGPPSVQYRGIFLNDEDWGLQPWAAKNIDTDVQDIGPNTYAKIFELMLRCKANYIWPAMHPSTKAFWYYPENPIMAKKYQIVLGSSHAEPMLRNNVDEWSNNFVEEYGYAPGEFNWATNRSQVEMYWTDRAVSSKDNDAFYTVGMRGIHDSKMEGYNSDAERAAATKEVINVQRDILSSTHGINASEIPQVFCPYKEALKLYRLGLDLADDITLLWVDDNYGYIRQLPNATEQQRSGGSGVYYHFSYWGWPDDYLWLSTISPSLTSYELLKAYELNAKKIWIVNVGDIKPNEMEMQFALDLAWDVNSWTPDRAHLYSAHWAAETFGSEFGTSIGKIKEEFFKLAASGKPEQLVSINYTEQQIMQRLADYDTLVVECEKVKAKIPSRLQEAFFELIEYPVKGAANMNTKILAARLSHTYASQGRENALELSAKALAAYDNIITLTTKYNTGIANGKWDGMMDYAPRALSRFYDPNVASTINNTDIPPPVEDSSFVIPASEYIDISSSLVKTMEGLGDQGSAITVWPMNMTTYTASDVVTAPYAEYDIKVKKGINKISVRCLPTFPLYESLQLRYAISIEGSTPVFFNIETSAETSPWAKNILQGYAYGTSNYISSENKTIKVRVYFTDPGLVVSSIASTGIDENELTTRLINPNFELKSDGIFNDGSTFRGIPYGWEHNGTLLGNSFGINDDGNNYSGNNLCWINSTPMPDEFELYQIVRDLEPGEYVVRCRMAVMSNTITNQRLFANNNVQYFGTESNYTSNLNVDEANSFAGYIPANSYDLKEVAVKVAVLEGDSLKLGIRSSNIKSNGNAATDNSGWFKVDHFRIELLRLFSGISVEKTKLDSLILVAEELYNTTIGGNNAGEYPIENRSAFNTAIQSAKSVYADESVSLDNVLGEITNLEMAIKTYKKAVISITSLMSNPDFEYKSEGILNDGSTVRGIPYGWSSTGSLIGNSFGINNEGVNFNGNNLCWINSFPMPDEFELYQNIDNLPEGRYLVQCRLAVMNDRVSNQRLFANNNVQYFGNESDYVNNLTDGEINTFAGWTPTASYRLRQMEVEVEISDGEQLTVGIRSGNLLSDGSREASNNAGWFKVDYFRVKPISVPTNIIDNHVNKTSNVLILSQKGGVVVKIRKVFNQGQIRLYSLNGNLLLNQPLTSLTNQVSISEKGMYIVIVIVDGELTTGKAVSF